MQTVQEEVTYDLFQLSRQEGQDSLGWTEVLKNTSGLIPLGRAVLVRPYEAKSGGVIELPESAKDRMAMLEQRCVVVAVGTHAWPDEPQRAKPGDKVLVAKMNGYTAKGDDGVMYRFVNDRDIFAGVTTFNDEEMPNV